MVLHFITPFLLVLLAGNTFIRDTQFTGSLDQGLYCAVYLSLLEISERKGKKRQGGEESYGVRLLALGVRPCLLHSAADVGVLRAEAGLQMLSSRAESGAGSLHLALGLQGQT